MLASDHTHREWRSRVWNVVGEAVEEELLPYKELFTTVVLEQVLVAAATLLLLLLLLMLYNATYNYNYTCVGGYR